MDPSITYFPVGNGDTSVIRLADQAAIMIDCSIPEASQDPQEPQRYDVRSHLLRELRRDAKGWPHVDAFILSHADEDHCRDLKEMFYLGDPAEYGEADAKEDRIIIDELWFAPRIFWPHESDLCEDAKAYRREARRRIALYRSGDAARGLPGNRLRVIGYSDNPELEGLSDILTVPGEEINLVNGTVRAGFSFFVHGPMKKDTDDKWAERNDTSIILQARFEVDGVPDAALAIFGGDAGCAVWEYICDISDEDALAWDILLAPHHCSWSFFSEAVGTEDESDEPSEKIMAFLGKGREGAWVISSSKPIRDDDDNPPHYKAAEEYRGVVGEDRLLCTAEYPDEQAPRPIRFTMSANGPVKDDLPRDRKARSSAAALGAVSEPATYG